ncbi:MAG: aldehyde dehydrogenase family protein [Actinomycetota bacterium]|nr:aldehyde dehydrogenase family protein [Actinomycetota bacterium]
MSRPEWSRETIYVDGRWSEPRGPLREVENPATEEIFGTLRSASAADAVDAILAARRATDRWAATSPAFRQGLLREFSLALQARCDLLVDTLVAEVGTPTSLARSSHFGQALAVLDSYVDLLGHYDFEQQLRHTRVLKESAGVVGAITPWNYPLYQLMAKVAPALAAGCSIVAKPAELTPLSALVLADAADAVGLPAGVLNIVPGSGTDVGAVLSSHPEVDVVSFTGSTQVGRHVAATAAATVKRVCLELGGKSASIVLPDAELQVAVSATVANVMVNSGQTCAAWTRLLVPAAQYDQSLAFAAKACDDLVVGDPRADTTDLGPVISDRQRRSVLRYIAAAISAGGELVAGGVERPDGLSRGHYVRPTVIGGAQRNSRVAQEEIFGPVLVVLPYIDVDDAVAIANGTSYGLAGSVWSGDDEKAFAVAKRLQTGRVDINGAAWNPVAPFGGYKQSGNGRELGRFGLEEYLEVKSVQLPERSP